MRYLTPVVCDTQLPDYETPFEPSGLGEGDFPDFANSVIGRCASADNEAWNTEYNLPIVDEDCWL